MKKRLGRFTLTAGLAAGLFLVTGGIAAAPAAAAASDCTASYQAGSGTTITVVTRVQCNQYMINLSNGTTVQRRGTTQPPHASTNCWRVTFCSTAVSIANPGGTQTFDICVESSWVYPGTGLRDGFAIKCFVMTR